MAYHAYGFIPTLEGGMSLPNLQWLYENQRPGNHFGYGKAHGASAYAKENNPSFGADAFAPPVSRPALRNGVGMPCSKIEVGRVSKT